MPSSSQRQFWREIHAVADRLEPKARKTFFEAVTRISKVLALQAEFEEISAERAIARAEAVLRQLAEQDAAFARLIAQAQEGAGKVAARQLGDQIRVSFRFDAARPEAVAWAQTRAAMLVREITTETRQALRTILARSFQEQIPARETARLIRSTIGLTRRQAMAVINYRFALLEAGKKPEIVARAAERYSAKLLRQRATLIARTEMMAASINGQQQAWRQAVQKGYLRADAVRVWVTTPDDRLCPRCQAMRGVTAPLEGTFTSKTGETVSAPPLHPACRCAVGVRTRSR